jgi:cephalosporin-C deacetylase-like acetyl esterase
MSRGDIEFQTHDHVTLRGWFYKPSSPTSNKLPCLVISHGFSALKEMDLNTSAEYFTSKLPLSCLVYDNRGFGSSDVIEGQPRHEIIPAVQCSDISDAITYAQSRTDVNADKVGIWGSSYSRGHVLWVGAVDRRVKAVLSQVPCVSGYDNFHRLIRPDFVAGLNTLFQEGNKIWVLRLGDHIDGYRSPRSICWQDCTNFACCRGRPVEALCAANT